MKALIRGEEVIIEPFSQWVESHLDWMTGKEKDSDGNPIAGDGWTLVEDFTETDLMHMGYDSTPTTVTNIVEPETVEETEPTEEEVITETVVKPKEANFDGRCC